MPYPEGEYSVIVHSPGIPMQVALSLAQLAFVFLAVCGGALMVVAYEEVK